MTLSNGKNYAYQWDTGLKVVTTDPEGTVRRFANEHGSKSIPVEAVDESGTVYYHIPNILLTTGRNIVMYSLGGNSDSIIYTDDEDFLPVYAAPKPDDYIFTDEEINLWKSLNDRMTAAEEDIATNTDNIALNAGAIATNTDNIATNTGNIASNTAAIGANTSDINAIKAAPHVHVFDTYESGDLWYSDEDFDDLVAAFHRGDHIYCYGPSGLVMPMVVAEYSDDDAVVVFGVPLQASANNEYGPSNGWLIAEYANSAWTISFEQDMIPQWLDTDGVTPGYVPTITADGVEWQAPQGGGGSDSVYFITLDQYDSPTNTISEIEDAIDAGKLLVAVTTESNGYSYVVMYKGEYDATSLKLYARDVDPDSGVSVYQWRKTYTYTYATTSWSKSGSYATNYTLPSGGTTGQALVKNSNTVGDTKWKTLAASDVGAIPTPVSPTNGDVLTYNGASWEPQAPSGGASNVFIIDLDGSYIPTCPGTDIIAAVTAKKALMCRKETVAGAPSYYSVKYFEDFSGGNCQFSINEPNVSGVYHTISLTRHTLFYDSFDDSWTYSSISETMDVDDVITKPASPSSGDVLTWNGSAWVAQALPVYDGS